LGRPDLVSQFRGASESSEITFVDYQGADPRAYAGLGPLVFWEQFRSAARMLSELKPEAILALAIDSRNQAALRLQAARRGIPVIHVEHGYRLPLSVRSAEGVSTLGRGSLVPRSSQRFYLGSFAGLGPVGAARMVRYGVETARGGSYTAMHRAADWRRADHYISFSPECLEFHRELDRLPTEVVAAADFTGVPQFDCFSPQRGIERSTADTAVLIDHQLHNAGILGWDTAAKREWAAEVWRAVRGSGRRLLVKPHPGDRSGSWDPFLGDGVELLDSIESLAAEAARVDLALGVMSTLQMPVAALPNVAMISLEVHPEPGRELTARFTEAGVSEPVFDFASLPATLARARELREDQLPHKPAFTERFLFRLDGGASERMTAAIERAIP
jgi:hypothetical protein